MYQLKWSNGEPYERSSINQFNSQICQNDQAGKNRQNPGGSNIPNTYNQRLDDPRLGLTPETIVTHNKREFANNKIIERGMYSQTSQNPFLNTNKYLDDINIQEAFLRPKNSNFEDNKETR